MLYVGYMPVFKWNDPTLLFLGDNDGLKKLSQCLVAAYEKFGLFPKTEYDLLKESEISNPQNLSVILSLTSGQNEIRADNARKCFRITMNEDGFFEVSGKLSMITKDDKRCHNYIEPEGDDIVIMISQDEYDPEIFYNP